MASPRYKVRVVGNDIEPHEWPLDAKTVEDAKKEMWSKIFSTVRDHHTVQIWKCDTEKQTRMCWSALVRELKEND